jgi:hypothetical protein
MGEDGLTLWGSAAVFVTIRNLEGPCGRADSFPTHSCGWVRVLRPVSAGACPKLLHSEGESYGSGLGS